tara:strand:+ start:1907 stop:2890 length:984 start_codon:yes stop_codon:yes gene_type:complete
MIKNNLNRILFIINSILLLLLLASYIAPKVHPDFFWHISLLGIFFPAILIINIIFGIYWLFSWKKYFWSNLVIILLGTSHIDNIIANQKNILDQKKFDELQKNKKHQFDQLINIMSYNVRLFNQNENINDDDIINKILDAIKIEKPNILCIQEFNLTNETKTIFDLYNQKNANDNKLQIMTKYKVINTGYIKSKNICIYKDIVLNDTIRVYNIHLQSNWVKSMKSSYKDRVSEALKIKKHINKSPYPVIVCGDFNDTPISYTYSNLKKGLADSFKESGIGIGNSYVGIPTLRIDYILHSKKYKSYNYKKNKYELSDHYPISCDILIP